MELRSKKTIGWVVAALVGYFLAGGTFHPLAILFSIIIAYITVAVAYSGARSFVNPGHSDSDAMWSLAYLVGPFVTFGVCWIILSFVGSGQSEEWGTDGSFKQYVAPMTYEAFYYTHLKMFVGVLVPSMFGIRLAEHKWKTRPPSFLDKYELEEKTNRSEPQNDNSD
jgi:hypothetical protein